MKKILPKLLIAMIALSVIGIAAGVWYAQKVFVPVKLKPFLIEKAKSAGVKIDFEGIGYSFPDKISVLNLTVFEKTIPGQKLLTAQRVKINFKLQPLLFKKQIIVNRVELKTLQVYPGPGRAFTSKGDLFLDGEFSYKINNPASLVYHVMLTLKDQEIKDVPVIKTISGLNGQLKIEANKISIIQLKGSSFECPVEFAGYLENFRSPYIDFSEKIDLNLSKVNDFLPDNINNSIKNISFNGKAAVILNIAGKVKDGPVEFNGHANFIDAQVKIQQLVNTINGINGEVDFNKSTLTITRLEAQYNNQSYTLKANITDFSAPSVYAVLNSQDLLLEAKLKAAEDYTHFDAIEANWFNSSINLVGDIQNYQNPQLKLSGDIKIDLEDIKKISSRIIGENKNISSILDNLKPKGACLTAIFLDCPVNNLADGEIGIKATSENANLAGFNLGAMDMSMQLKNKVLFMPKLNLTPYEGALNMQGQMDWTQKDKASLPVYNLYIDLSGVNLEKLAKDTAFKNNNVWGMLSIKTMLNGAGSDLGNIKGSGWITVTNGHLWEFPLLGGLADTLNMPALKKIEIKETAGNFAITDKKIETQDLKFLVPQVNMLAKGNLGFDGNLDFGVGLSFASSFAGENEFSKLANLLIDKTGNLIGQVAVSGTIKEPKYTFVPLHLDSLIKNQLIESLASRLSGAPGG